MQPGTFSIETPLVAVGLRRPALHALGLVRFLGLLLVMLLAILQGGCERPAAEQVGELAVARWDDLRNGRWAEAYQLMSSEFRGHTSLEQFQGSFSGSVGWEDVRVTTVECEGASCRVIVVIDYVALFGSRSHKGTQELLEIWTFDESDRAWRLQKIA